MRRILMLVYLLILSITPVIAQTDETEAWEIVERCVGEPVTPPDDWSLEGIIFLRSSIGIHGLNSDIDTPYIIAYKNRNQTFTESGALSPDGRWFAVPTGRASTERFRVSAVWDYFIRHIQVYSTDGRRQLYIVDVNRVFVSDISGIGIEPPQWLDNNEFVYEDGPTGLLSLVAINPFTGEHRQYEGEYNPQLLYLTNHSNDNALRDTLASSLDAMSFGIIDDPYSEHFTVSNGNQLYIGDTTETQLIDTCLEWQNRITGIAFSPSGELAVSDGERVSIINFEEDTHYIAAYHEGSVFDWRVPPEEE